MRAKRSQGLLEGNRLRLEQLRPLSLPNCMTSSQVCDERFSLQCRRGLALVRILDSVVTEPSS